MERAGRNEERGEERRERKEVEKTEVLKRRVRDY